MAVTGELETADESEQETTDSDSIRYCCTFCGHNYRRNIEGCEHLVCKVESLESNFDFVEAPDHPVTATLFGQEVPRVVATRFMAHVRQTSRRALLSSTSTPSTSTSTSTPSTSTSTPSPSSPYMHTSSAGVVFVDLLAEKRANTGLSVIRTIHKSASCFCERTFYLAACPSELAPLFAPFVRSTYCGASDSVVVEIDVDGDMMDLEGQPSVPFSRVQIYSEVMVLDAEDLIPEIYPNAEDRGRDTYSAGSWVMLDGLPDRLPLFFFATHTLTQTPPPRDDHDDDHDCDDGGARSSPLFINHSANLPARLKAWSFLPGQADVYVLHHLPSVVIN